MALSHFSSSFCIFALTILPFFILPTSAILGNETDQLALLAFRAEVTDDPLGVLRSWNQSVHFCQWHGVICGRRHQRVTVLDLRTLNLAGSISPYIGNLSFLRELYLGNNSFTNKIPQEIGRLQRLQTLNLRNNSLEGEIPANLTSCANLIILELTRNQLEGKIPLGIGSLSNLQVLSLQYNSFTGNIPSSLGNLSSLVQISLLSNRLSGTIPHTIGKLKNLTFLSVAGNGFVGTIPPSIFNLSSIEVFDFGQNQLQGSLPSNLGDLFPFVEFFSIDANPFTGSIPASISNASNLVDILISNSKITGNVPNLENLRLLQWLILSGNHLGSNEADDLNFLSSLTNISSLQYLYIDYNNFAGILPESISNLSSELTDLVLASNRIVGRIPAGIGKFKNLERLEMWDNQLSGRIPEDIGNLRNLEVMRLYSNEFTGNIPSSFENLEKLTILQFQGNKFEGSIPSSLGKCQKLLELDISDNKISGTIPSEIFTISSLSVVLNLSRNHLTGDLPVNIGNLKNLGKFDISHNLLSGVIPASLGSCVSLEVLKMQGNYFSGTIPSSFQFLRGVVDLDLSQNSLSGEFPKFLEGLVSLHNLNASFNSFVGMVPREGVFKNASAVSVGGNNGLCGGVPELHLRSCNVSEPKKRRLSHKLKLVISVVSASLGAFVAVSFLFLCWFRKKSRGISSSSPENSFMQVSYQTLCKATDGFASTKLIGVGSFGSVYKGTLNDGEVVAVKVFNLQRHGASNSFIAECKALRNIRHRNLVRVITACSSIDTHGNDFKAIVYELMANGSLEEWLHPTHGLRDLCEAERKMSMLQRLNIAIDVACAMDYLHHQVCQAAIVHCDLKPSNVLLDEEMTAHVADFGLAKFLSEGTHNFSRIQTSSAGVRGTVGYAAPEYGMGSEVSTYGDMYSYGILLLEMFSGKRPTDDMFNDKMNLHNYVKMALPEKVTEITEPILLIGTGEDKTESSRESNQKDVELLALIFEIGIACTEDVPRERMSISEAVAKLLDIRNKAAIGAESRELSLQPANFRTNGLKA